MRTTINIDDQLIRETETVYKAESRSKSIEKALRDVLLMKKREKLKEMVGKIEFDEDAVRKLRDTKR
jgi:metal-responsive CopG/Arc/MetJ family transcriptional regulator